MFMNARFAKASTIVVDHAAIIINHPEIAECLRLHGGGGARYVRAYIENISRSHGIQRQIRQLHVVTARSALSPAERADFAEIGANVHEANGDDTGPLFAVHALRASVHHDTVIIAAAGAHFLPVLREMKFERGCKVALAVMPTTHPPLFGAADELIDGHPVAITGLIGESES